MATIQIRDVPDDAYETLREQAHAAGQSLQAYMRALVVDAADVSRRKVEAIRALEQALISEGPVGVSPEEIVDALEHARR